jgi:hypothetical protein
VRSGVARKGDLVERERLRDERVADSERGSRRILPFVLGSSVDVCMAVERWQSGSDGKEEGREGRDDVLDSDIHRCKVAQCSHSLYACLIITPSSTIARRRLAKRFRGGGRESRGSCGWGVVSSWCSRGRVNGGEVRSGESCCKGFDMPVW